MQASDSSGGRGGQMATSTEPWLDMDTAIARMLGNRSLYFSMLDLFRTQLLQDMEQMQQALGSGNQKEALRLIHSTKGAARILGAEHLAARTEHAYDAVVYGDVQVIAGEISALLSCAAETLTHIERAINANSL